MMQGRTTRKQRAALLFVFKATLSPYQFIYEVTADY